MLMSFDPLYALLVIVVLVLPYLIWLIRADTLAMPPWPDYRRTRRQGAALGRAARRPVAGDVRHRAAGDPQLRLVRPQGRRTRRSSTGRRSIRWRANSSISSPSRPALGGSLIAGLFNLDRVTGGAGVALADVGAGRDRRDRRSRLSAAPAAAALGLGCALIAPALRGDRGHAVPALDRRRRSADLDAGARRSRISSATVLSGAPTSGCARWPAIRSWRA